MRTKSKPRLSYSECLYVIEKFGVNVAQKIVGGKPTTDSHPLGDLEHEDGSYSEVKATQISAGPIIRQEQLTRHFESSEEHDRKYVFVLYEGRRWDRTKKKYISLPVKIGMKKGKRALEAFLAQKLKAVYVGHVSVVWAIFQAHEQKGDLQEYMMQRGQNRYIKIPYTDLKAIRDDSESLKRFSLDPVNYEVQTEKRSMRVGYFKPQIDVVKIIFSAVIDDSFDVNLLESSFKTT